METQKTYGLIGKKLGHSFSAMYFTEKFFREEIPARYTLFELDRIEALPLLIQETPSLAGLNVTIPFKEQIIPYLNTLSEAAAEIGAVNTIRIDESGLSGFNTDVYGFTYAVNQLMDGKAIPSALIIGTGGAAKAAAWALRHDFGTTEICYISRAPSGPDQTTYAEAKTWDLSQFGILVNASPVGMYPDILAAPELNYASLGKDQAVMDMIYNPWETVFLEQARKAGARVMNGLDMLIAQAEKAWEIWTD